MSAAMHYDVIIIGTGAGGGTLAHRLAPSGKRILLLERGGYVPREKDNWDPKVVNLEAKYHTKEVWRDKDGHELHPHTNVKGSMRRAPPGNVVTLQPGTRGRSMPHRTPLN
jgi:choline dehydrogenase-like flavoprotein